MPKGKIGDQLKDLGEDYDPFKDLIPMMLESDPSKRISLNEV